MKLSWFGSGPLWAIHGIRLPYVQGTELSGLMLVVNSKLLGFYLLVDPRSLVRAGKGSRTLSTILSKTRGDLNIDLNLRESFLGPQNATHNVGTGRT